MDVLVSEHEASRAISKIIELGYKAEVREPYCTTFIKGSSIVDLYIHPIAGGVIFINGHELLKYVRIAEFNGIEIKTLRSYVEAW